MATGDRSTVAGARTRKTRSDGFRVEQVTTGPHANGFGRTDDGRPFAFRVHKSTLYVEVYRPNPSSPVPDAGDVSAAAEQSMTEVDLADERSVVAAVRDAVFHAGNVDGSTRDSSPVRALIGRVGALIDSF